jgi:tellurite resistance protein TerA
MLTITDPDSPVLFSLTWNPARDGSSHRDLDIGCLYILRNGDRGAVQAVGGLFGHPSLPPYIHVPRDNRDGVDGTGELLVISEPAQIAFAVVFASIYAGNADFRGSGAGLDVICPGSTYERVEIRSPDPGLRWCAIAVCGASEGRFLIRYQHRFFLSARHADDHYGIGLEWGIGLKD